MNKSEEGKKSRASGKAFELKVRKDLEKKGWIVCRWSNNVEFNETVRLPEQKVVKFGVLIPAKHTFNPFTKAMSAGNGFPDFICIKRNLEVDASQICNEINRQLIITGSAEISKDSQEILDLRKRIEDTLLIPKFKVQLVESKMIGKLDKLEKEKVEWIKNNLHISVLVASKGKKRGEIKYE